MTACCQAPSSNCAQHLASPLKAALSVALVGNPNCGKTTLFNALTGARQKVGNWPGVTVERKSGHCHEAGKSIEIIDLPGVYSLMLAPDMAAIDEQIACDFVFQRHADVVVNIVDASNLERHLYLSVQLLELGVPVVLALNMMDVARSRHIHINLKKLSQELGCPVVALEANNGSGVAELKRVLINHSRQFTRLNKLNYPAQLQQAIAALKCQITDNCCKLPDDKNKIDAEWLAMRLLEGDAYAEKAVTAPLQTQAALYKTQIKQDLGEDADILLADARYQYIQSLLQEVVSRASNSTATWTSRIDDIVLNRFLGIPFFLGVMYLLFFFSINIGGAFQDFFDIGSQTIFVDGFAYWLNQHGSPVWLTVLLANGIGKGINTTITFIPVIGAMFFFLAVLEDSGYMARAAFVIDRFMRALGLPGKAFVPMIVGFGCNVPAVMGARTLENQRDRIITIMMSPFMSCGARLAIYSVFTAAFFPRGGQNVVFALYLIGIFMAVATGFLLRQTVLKGEPSPLIMELPSYHWPRLRTLLLHAWQRLKNFVFRAGRLILPICILIGVLNTLNVDGSMNTGEGSVHSLLSWIGRWVTPIFTPMGIKVDNWPATVGLVTGILAKEVVVGTLNTLYSQVGHFAAGGADTFQFWAGLQEAWHSIPANFAALGSAFSNPVLAKAPIHTVNQGVYGLMYQRFDGQIGAFAYLLFVLLYFPCISTTAAMLREVHRGWSIFSVFWMTGVAYGTAVIFYQAATWGRHPLSSFVWIAAIAGILMSVIIFARQYTKPQDLPMMQKVKPC